MGSSERVFGPALDREWFDDPRRYRGISELNVKYLREFKELSHDNAVLGTLTFFLLTRLNIASARTMMNSAKKQKKFIGKVIIQLREWVVLPRHVESFEFEIKRLRERKDNVFRICKECIKLTKHYPYFMAVGFDKLFDFDTKYVDGESSVLDPLIADMELWEKNHQDEIEKYMASVKGDVERHNAFIERNRKKAKEEKEAERAKIRAEKAEIKMLKEQAKINAKEKKKLDRELDTTVRRAHGNWRGEPGSRIG